MGVHGINPVADAAVESFLCRSRDVAKDVSYGDSLSFRCRLRENLRKLTVSGRLEKHGGTVMLVAGDLYLHLADTDIQAILPPGYCIDDFVWSNRPFDLAARKPKNTSKTGGVLEYTLLFKDGVLRVSGLNKPVIREDEWRPLIDDGISRKSPAKQKLDLHKRGKNM
jgi:hypothetical protein